MSLKVNAKTTEETLSEKFEKDGKLLGDVSTILTFAAAVVAGDPLSIAAGAALILKTAGAAISSGTQIVKRLGSAKNDDTADVLPAYDRFRVVFYVTCQKCFIESLNDALTAFERKKKEECPELKQADVKQLREQLKLQVANLYEAEVSYLFCIEPLNGDVPLYEAFARWTVSALTYHGFSPSEAHEIAGTTEKGARKRFHVFLAGKDETAEWMRNYLALTERAASSSKLLSDLSAIRDTLAHWTEEREELKQGQKRAWAAYRELLAGLPDQKETMFSEDFGVRKVFVQPKVHYHIRGSAGNAGQPQPVGDLGRLIGALISSRVSGEDLIILCGGPGSGKSTLCRIIASELAANPDVHPVFLRLRRVKEGAEIGQFIEESLQKLGLINRIADLREIPNLVLILDGFDELVMASRARLRHFFNVLREDLGSGPLRNAKAIVSGRDTLFPRGEGLPLGSHVLSLQAFNKVQVKAWGAKWRHMHKSGPGNSFHPEEFVEEKGDEGRKPPLHHLVSWPLTLHLVARVHTAGKLDVSGRSGKRVEKAFLYRSILSETASRQTEQTEGTGRLDSKKMREFLRALGWEMHSKSVDSMDPADVIPLLKRYYPDKTEVDLAELAEVAVVNSPELTKGEETGFEFVHKSFAEFLVGERFAELVERVAFKAPEFGADDWTWRMSEQEAARELAPMLAIRLIPEEVQEMFEPMLGCFGPFSKGERVDETITVGARRDGLTRIVERFEMLYSDFLRGGSFETVGKLAGASSLAKAPLEAYANYCAGVLLIGTAAVRQSRQFGGNEKERRLFIGDPFRGALWRALCILAAGGLPLDEALSTRLLDGMLVNQDEQGGAVNDMESPIRFGYLSRAEGYDARLSEHLERTLQYSIEMERILFVTQLLVQWTARGQLGGRSDQNEFWLGREFHIFTPDRMRQPIMDMTIDLIRNGFVDSKLERLLHESDDGYRRWLHEFERAMHRGPGEAMETIRDWLEDSRRWSRHFPAHEFSRYLHEFFRREVHLIAEMEHRREIARREAKEKPAGNKEE